MLFLITWHLKQHVKLNLRRRMEPLELLVLMKHRIGSLLNTYAARWGGTDLITRR